MHTILDELHGTALILELEALSPAHLKAVIARRDRFDRGIRQVLEEGIADGSFAPDDVKLRSFALLGAVNWIPRWFNPAGPATSSEIADRFADYLLAGLRLTEEAVRGWRLKNPKPQPLTSNLLVAYGRWLAGGTPPLNRRYTAIWP